MPCSTLQAEIIMYLNFLLTQALGIKDFRIFASESGNHLAKNVNYGLDLAVYDKKVLSSDKINNKFANVPPELVVEVDVKVELEKESEMDFIIKQTESLLNYGTKTVIWVTSPNKKVIIAQANQDWVIKDWSKDFELMKGIIANIGKYLEENEIGKNWKNWKSKANFYASDFQLKPYRIICTLSEKATSPSIVICKK